MAAVAATGWVVTTRPAAAATTATTGTVYYWNSVLLDVFRRQGGGPGPLARGAAMMHGSIFDVLNSAQWSRQGGAGSGYDPAFGLLVADLPVDDDLAAGIAARDALIDAFPAQRTFIKQRYKARHGTASQAAASRLASQATSARRSSRKNDGATSAPTYKFDKVPGAWRLTGGGCTSPVDPLWGQVRPFVMSSSTQFRRQGPGGFTTYRALLASSLYAKNFNRVKSLGRNTSTTRTADQTQSAFFWANDTNGTYKPPGQLLDHTRTVAQPRIDDPIVLARLFTLVSFAMADAVIAAWDMKFRLPIDLWRPVTAIHLAGTDNNPATVPDSAWQPLGATPCFPAWPSGHATLAGAWSRVMIGQFGDRVSFVGKTDDPNAVGVTRTFKNFTAAAEANALSRIYLGVHFPFNMDGLGTGRKIGNLANKRIQRVNCPKACYY